MALIPKRLEFWARRVLKKFVPSSRVVEEWEWYARDFERSGETRTHLGDEWNQPEQIGAAVASSEIVRHLDEHVFKPFIDKVDTILEIGAGGGRFTEVLVTKASLVIAADTAPTMLKLLRRRFARDPRVRTVLLDGRSLGTLPNASVDVVFSYDVFVHLPHWEIFNYLREMKRVLRLGGRAVIHHGNVLSELGWKKFLDDAERERAGLAPRGRFTFVTPSIMAVLIERAGLHLERSEEQIVRRDAIAFISKYAKAT
jgi:SAM-dependent methyltransferase